jgi:succinate dehydrogenase / fumarate reductase, cytochrome b subunit
MHGAQRPLSPHLSIYRWQITMWLSSLHRITGLLLSLGAVALAAWLIAAATSEAAYAEVAGIVGAPWFKLPLVAWTFCFFYHLANGVRHLAWDAGLGFDKSRIRASGWAVVLAAVAATAVFAAVVIV